MTVDPRAAESHRAPDLDADGRTNLLVLHVAAPDSRQRAEHVYRISQPCRALGTLGDVTVVSGSLLSPTVHALLPTADVLVMSDLADPDLLPILETRRRSRRLSVYETNHHHLFPPPGVPAPPAGDLIGRSLSPQLARQSDCLQLPTDELDRRFRLVNPRRAVFPSNRWDQPAATITRPSTPVRIGWGGAIGHADDVRHIAPALRAVADRHPQVQLALYGDPVLRELFSDLPPDRFSFTPESSPEAYEAFLQGLTIGVSPLLPTTYNRCRSDSKFLEYAAHHVLAVCSDLEPYATVRARDLGLLFGTTDELETVLERALSDPRAGSETTARAVRYIDRERLERPNAPRRLGFYLATMASIGYTSPWDAAASRPRPSRPLLGELEEPPTFPGSSYVAIGADTIEKLLVLGIEADHAGDPAEAIRRFEEAGTRAPTFHLPRLLAGMAEPDPQRALASLRRATELGPRSCRAVYELGVRLHASGDGKGARAAWERCRILAPAFGAAEARLAELADAEGQLEEACRRFEEAALHNSFLAWPVARLAAKAIDGGQLERAAALLRPSLQQDEELWLTNFLLGRVCLDMGRIHEAHVHLSRALDAPISSGADRAAVLALLATVELRRGAPAASRARLQELRHNEQDHAPGGTAAAPTDRGR